MHNNNSNRFAIGLLITSLLMNWLVHAAPAPAGAIIKNQASATYKDASGVVQFTTSNMVETLIQQVAAIELVQAQTKLGIVGKVTYFPHVLTNTGNGNDVFDLTATDLTGDDYDFEALTIYADENKDGLPDSTVPITMSQTLVSEGEFYFVVAAEVPAGATPAQTANFEVKAVSTFDNSVDKVNNDAVKVTDKALVDVTKSINVSGGASPSGPYTVTLSYKNHGSQPASNVTLIDALPAGMTYVEDSGRWSVTGESITLTDATNNDAQGSGDTIIYCAHQPTCTGLAESDIDVDSDSTNQVTAIITSVGIGGKGTLTFQVNIDNSLDAGKLYNTAEFEYNDSSAVVPRVNTNTVPFNIQAALGVVANGSASDNTDGVDNKGGTTDSVIVDTAQQGESVSFDNYIWNTSNSTDTYEMTLNESGMSFPAGTVFMLFNSDGATPLMDTNADGTPDTGPIAGGDVEKIVVRAILPNNSNGNNGGAGFEIDLRATSTSDPVIFNTVTDKVGSITAAEVDLMNDASSAGLGAGAEGTAVTTQSVTPGEAAVFNLYVNNNGGSPDNYLLQYSSTDFNAGTLPAGWEAGFYLDGGNNDCSTLGTVVTSTGVIPANDSRLICGVISVPDSEASMADAQSIYFKVSSPITNTADIIHDAVQVATVSGVTIEPSHSSQTEPGVPIVYTHQITNQGNIDLECLNVTEAQSESDWNAVLYHDANDDQQHDSTDPMINDLNLPVGTTETIFVKIFSPSNVAPGIQNTTTLTVTANVDDGVAGCSGAAKTAVIADVTVASNSYLNIFKEQALDADCNGTEDASFGTNNFQVNPGECVLYRLTSKNNGVKEAKNVRIDDAAPDFTTFYHAGSIPSTSAGNLTGAIDGSDGAIAAGSVSGATVNLQPGQSLEVIFGVKLD